MRRGDPFLNAPDHGLLSLDRERCPNEIRMERVGKQYPPSLICICKSYKRLKSISPFFLFAIGIHSPLFQRGELLVLSYDYSSLKRNADKIVGDVYTPATFTRCPLKGTLKNLS